MASESLADDLKARRSAMVVDELEAAAIRLFAQRGFASVTVEQIALEARVSPRTFYRYFPAKEDVIQVRIARRSMAIDTALAARPADETPLHSVRLAFEQATRAEDIDSLRLWQSTIEANGELLIGVVGGKMLKIGQVLTEFLAARLGQDQDAVVPRMLAAAIGGVTDAAYVQWFREGGDLVETVRVSLDVLERALVIPGGDEAS